MAKSDVVSDEDVQKAQEEVEALRQELADTEAARLEKERSDNNAIVLAQLEAEKARLKSQLVVAKSEAENAGVSTNESPLAAARAAAEAAAAQAAAQEAALADKAKIDAEQAEQAAESAGNQE